MFIEIVSSIAILSINTVQIMVSLWATYSPAVFSMQIVNTADCLAVARTMPADEYAYLPCQQDWDRCEDGCVD